MPDEIKISTTPAPAERFPGMSDFYAQLDALTGLSQTYEETIHAIPVEAAIDHYHIENPHLKDLLRGFPIFMYALGAFDEHGTLTEGLGFINPPKDQISRVSGLWNHVLGSARIAYLYAQVISEFSDWQKEVLRDQGFGYVLPLRPELYRDTILVSHAGELAAKDTASPVHVTTDRAMQTAMVLSQYQAPAFVRALQVSEVLHTHKPSLPEKLSAVPMILPQISDWHFGQEYVHSLPKRFIELRKRYGKVEWHTQKGYLEGGPEYLDILLGMGMRFDVAVQQAGELPDRWQNSLPIPQWEKEVRTLLAASVDSMPSDLWPQYSE